VIESGRLGVTEDPFDISEPIMTVGGLSALLAGTGGGHWPAPWLGGSHWPILSGGGPWPGTVGGGPPGGGP
jgi:hypothetical protein